MADAVLDLAGLDTQTTDTTPAPEPVEPGIGEASEPVEPAAGGEPESVDGRRGPKAYRDAANAAAQAMPEHAAAIKEMAANSFRLNAYQQHFAKPEEAGQAKQLIEALGGNDGVANLQQRIQAVDLQDSGLKEGNPEVLDAMFKDFPEGAVALAPHYLSRLEKTNPQAFASAVAPYAIDLIVHAGLEDEIKAAYNAQDPKPVLQKMFDWLQGQKQGAQKLRETPTQAPGADKIKQREQELNQREEQIFFTQVQDKVTSTVTPELDKAVDQYAKQYKLNDTQKMHFKNTLQAKLVEEMNNDKTYKQQVDLRKANKTRTAQGIADYIAGEFKGRVKDAAFAVARDVYGATKQTPTTTGVVKPNQPKTAPNGGPLFVSQRPGNNDLDLSRPDAEMLMIQGKGYRKADGMFVTWRKS